MLNRSTPLDRLFQALADPARRRMVERLGLGPASASELARLCAMSLPGAVQHLAVLERSGLVRSEKHGRVRVYRLVPTALQGAEHWIAGRWSDWDRRLSRLGDYLAGDDDEPQNRKRK
jgi:DNA-binding transcriptional ArsR family regulator